MSYFTQLLFQNIKNTHPDLISNYPDKAELIASRDFDGLSSFHLMALNPGLYKQEIHSLLDQAQTTEQRIELLTQPIKLHEFNGTMCPITMDTLNTVSGLLYITEDNQIRYLGNMESFWGIAKNSINSYLETEYNLDSIGEMLIEEQLSVGFNDDRHDNGSTVVSSEQSLQANIEVASVAGDIDWETDSDSVHAGEIPNEQTSESAEISMNEFIGLLAQRMEVDLTKAEIKCPNTRQAITGLIPLALLTSEQLNLLRDKDNKLIEFIDQSGKTERQLLLIEELKQQIINSFPKLNIRSVTEVIKLKAGIESIDNQGLITLTSSHVSVLSKLSANSNPIILMSQSVQGLETLDSIFKRYPGIFKEIEAGVWTSCEARGSNAIYWLTKSEESFECFKMLIQKKPEMLRLLTASVLSHSVYDDHQGMSILLNMFQYKDGRELITNLFYTDTNLRQNLFCCLYKEISGNKDCLNHMTKEFIQFVLTNKEHFYANKIVAIIINSHHAGLKEIISTEFSENLSHENLLKPLTLLRYNQVKMVDVIKINPRLSSSRMHLG